MRFRAVLALLLLATPAAADPVKMRLAYVPAIGAAPVFVLVGAGWAKDAGIEVVLSKFDSGPPAINALASGTIDALAIGVAPIAVARAKGLDVRIVAAAATGGSAFVAAPKLGDAFDAAAGDPARAFSAFRQANGRPATLATTPPGGVPMVALNHWLFKLNNVPPGDVQIVAMGIDAIQQALLAGAVDGGTALEPSLTIVRDRDPRLKTIVTADQMFDGVPGVAVAVSGAFAKANPAAVETLVGLVVRAVDFVAKRPEEASAYVQPILSGGLVDQTVMARAMASKAVAYVADPRAIEAPTRRMLDYQVELGDFAAAPSMDGLFDTGPYSRLAGK